MAANKKFVISLLILSATVLGVYLGAVLAFSRNTAVPFAQELRVRPKKLSPQQPPSWVIARRVATSSRLTR